MVYSLFVLHFFFILLGGWPCKHIGGVQLICLHLELASSEKVFKG